MRRLVTQFTRFGLVGLVGFVVDVGVFNLLRVTVLDAENLHEGPVIAKVISTSLAIVTNWLGNRYWTFGALRRPHWLREAIEFVIVSIGGMAIAVGCLIVSRYVLGYESLLADNIATNVVGLALGTAFRFTLYRLWVFSPRHLLGAAETPVGPAGVAPELAVETVAAVENDAAAGSLEVDRA